MATVCLVFVFNHRFERNVAKMEAHYGERFGARRYLMPFATSSDPSIIRVMENGFTFSGHIAQGATGYLSPAFSHYIFMGDDLILNPRLNEDNIIEALGLSQGQSYIKSMASADALRYRWFRALDGVQELDEAGFDYLSELPSPAEAEQQFRRFGLRFDLPKPTLRDWMWAWKNARHARRWLFQLVKMRNTPSTFPLVSGYSDFVVVPAVSIKAFIHYCGIFAAANSFAEFAVPTSLALASCDVKTELLPNELFDAPDAKRNPEAHMAGLELWGPDIERFANNFEYSLDRMFGDFPQDRLYVHPVKLSKWR